MTNVPSDLTLSGVRDNLERLADALEAEEADSLPSDLSEVVGRCFTLLLRLNFSWEAREPSPNAMIDRIRTALNLSLERHALALCLRGIIEAPGCLDFYVMASEALVALGAEGAAIDCLEMVLLVDQAHAAAQTTLEAIMDQRSAGQRRPRPAAVANRQTVG